MLSEAGRKLLPCIGQLMYILADGASAKLGVSGFGTKFQAIRCRINLNKGES